MFKWTQVWLKWPDLWRTENINRMITLTVITISWKSYLRIANCGSGMTFVCCYARGLGSDLVGRSLYSKFFTPSTWGLGSDLVGRNLYSKFFTPSTWGRGLDLALPSFKESISLFFHTSDYDLVHVKCICKK